MQIPLVLLYIQQYFRFIVVICFMMEEPEYQVNNNDLFHDGGNGVPSEQ
jgi:hypothetical protein